MEYELHYCPNNLKNKERRTNDNVTVSYQYLCYDDGSDGDVELVFDEDYGN